MRVAGTFYRGHDPKWAWTPLSGEGAAIHGGRWNPRGMPALYLGSDIMGVVAEMSHGLVDRIRPLTMCAYSVDCDDIADLTTEAGRAEHGVDPAAMACPWFLIAAEGGEPPSWAIARRLIEAGRAGLLALSFAPGAPRHHTNLVLWHLGAGPAAQGSRFTFRRVAAEQQVVLSEQVASSTAKRQKATSARISVSS